MKINQFTFLTTIGLYGYAVLFWELGMRYKHLFYGLSTAIFIGTAIITIYFYLQYYYKVMEETK